MSDTNVLRTVCNTSTWLATSRCASTNTASAGVGASNVDATWDGTADRVPAGRRGCAVRTGEDRSSMCSNTSSSHSSHVHASGEAAAAAGGADAGGRRTTAVISPSSSSSSSAESRDRAVTSAASRAKSINTESVEHNGDERDDARGADGDHTGPTTGRGRRDTTPPVAAPGSCSDGCGGASGGSGRGSVGGRATRESDGGGGGGGVAATGRGLSDDETDEVDDQPEGAPGLHGGEDVPQRGDTARPLGVRSGGANILRG